MGLSNELEELRKELEKRYPIEASYGSRQSLWAMGLKDGIVTQEQYNNVRLYYGKIWNYAG